MVQPNQQVTKIKDYVTLNDPAFAGITLWCPHFVVQEDTIAYTDGYCIYVGQLFFQLSEKEQAGVIAHEVLHIALCHILRGKTLNLPPLIWNLATDAVINYGLSQMSWLKLPSGVITLECLISSEDLKTTPKAKWTSEMVADYLMRKMEAVSGDGGEGEGEGESKSGGQEKDGQAQKLGAPKDWQSDLKPQGPSDKAGIKVPAYVDQHKADPDYMQQSNWADRLAKAERQKGVGSSNILIKLSHEFPTSETPWHQHLRRFMKTPLLPQRQTNWSRCSRRMMSTGSTTFDPGLKQKSGIKNAAVIVDTSGSIYSCARLLEQFVAEIDKIQRLTGATIHLIYADAEVVGDHICKADGKSFKQKMTESRFPVQGGGGTDFRPALKLLESRNISVAVYLTDLWGDFPDKSPPFPIIWAATEPGKAPFGHTIQLKL